MRTYTILLSLAILLILSSFSSFSQVNSTEQTVGVPWTGEPGITVSVAELNKAEKAVVTPTPFKIRPPKREYEVERDFMKANPNAPAVSTWPPSAAKLKKMNEVSGTLSPQQVGVSFLGAQISETPGWIPPDIVGDVGPTQVLIHVNGRIKIFDKSGTVGSLNVSDTVFWSSVRKSQDVCDAHVRYDPISQRWFLCNINLPSSGANRILIAVSSGSTITNTSSFTFFQFQQDSVGTAGADAGLFADYPTLGVDANAVYIGANMFNDAGSFGGSSGFVVKKSGLISGTLTVTPFRQLNNGSGAGIYTPQGVQNDDATATEGYFIGVDNATYGQLDIRRITNPGGTPSISGNLILTVPSTADPVSQVAKGSTYPLDGLDIRLFAAHIKKNKNTGLTSLWTAHNIAVTSSGVGSSSGDRNGCRWYEITNLTSTPSLRQSGTVYSTASSSPIGYWIPSVAMSGQGHMALGASYASANLYSSIAVTGRFSDDALGTTQSITNTLVGTAAYNAETSPTSGNQRWGDFTQTVVDPSDDMTMWTFQEYCNSTSSWALRVIQLLAPPPATPASTSPVSVNTNVSSVNVVLTGTSVSGSGFFDPGTGFTKRISASVNGTGVTVNSITYTSPTSITLNLTVASTATPGSRTITVTNPDGQTATSASGILTIINASCATITLNPTTLPGGAAGAGYNQTLTASGGTSPYTYAVTTGALPAGVTLSSAGILSGTPTYGGSYSFTVTASDSNGCPGTQAYSLSVTGCPQITLAPTGLSNGTIGTAYSQTITASGGTASYTYAVTSGSLPAGLTLSSGGTISGTPTTAATSSFTITATDASACTGSQAYSITVTSATPVGSTINLTVAGNAYTQNFDSLASSSTSSTVPYGWSFSESGTSANSTYTAGTGSSTTGDTYSFGSASATDRAFGSLASNNVTSTIGAGFTNNTGGTITSLTISFTTEEWRLGATGHTDSSQFAYSTDATSLTTGSWTVFSLLDLKTVINTGTTGALNGNSTANRAAVSSTISGLSIANGAAFYIRWTDFNISGADDGLAVDDFSLTPTTAATPTNLSVIGSAAPATVATGAATLLTATVTPGTIPTSSGITVTADISSLGGSSTQTLYDDATHGDVTASDNIFSYSETIPSGTTTGTKLIRFAASDAQARTANDSINITVTASICPTITISPSSLISPATGRAYNQNITAAGGVTPYTFALTHGSLPSGLTLAANGTISGTTTAIEADTFTVTATDSNGCTGSKEYALQVNACLSINPATLPNDTVGKAYSQIITATGGTAPYSFTVSSGALPTGITLSPSGVLSGSGTEVGTFNFSITVSDTFGCFAAQSYSMTTTYATETVTVPVKEHWNILSNPYVGGNDSLNALFPGATSSAYTFDGSGYQPMSTLKHGAGYWVKFGTATMMTLSGYPAIVDTLGLSAGWNLVGSAPRNIPVSKILSRTSLLQSKFFGYNNGYFAVDTLKPGRGYWVKSSQNGLITLPSPAATAKTPVSKQGVKTKGK